MLKIWPAIGVAEFDQKDWLKNQAITKNMCIFALFQGQHFKKNENNE